LSILFLKLNNVFDFIQYEYAGRVVYYLKLKGDSLYHIGTPVKAGVRICNEFKSRYPWEDKAGGYGIQDAFGAKFIKGIKGDYNNVVGLPTSRLYQELKKLNVL